MDSDQLRTVHGYIPQSPVIQTVKYFTTSHEHLQHNGQTTYHLYSILNLTRFGASDAILELFTVTGWLSLRGINPLIVAHLSTHDGLKVVLTTHLCIVPTFGSDILVSTLYPAILQRLQVYSCAYLLTHNLNSALWIISFDFRERPAVHEFTTPIS